MAESMVTFAMEKLADFLAAEAGLLGSLPKDIRDLEMELRSIKAVLRNAEKKAEEDDAINEWLMQVQTIAYTIEDVIDEFLLLKQQQKQPPRHSYNQVFWIISRIRSWLGKAVVCVSQLKPKHELSSKIKDIKTDIIEINSRRERYRFSTSTVEEIHLQDPRVSSLFMDDSEVVGIEDRKKELIQSMNLELEDRFVIAVVGMGGIGKTTLVRKVYEELIENQSFDVHAWVTVSQSYKSRDLLMTIFKQVHRESSQIADDSEEDIISSLRNRLKSKRYIAVFDDVWDAELWKLIKSALPHNNRGSRILVTTRESNIAREWEASLGGGHIYDLEPLPRDAAWDLFTHKIFGKGNCPQDLKEPARDMVAKCNGLPLAIVAVAGLLSTKKKARSEWNKLRNSIGTELGGNRCFDSTKRILLLSYHELPYYLKPCFLYFGMFPEDFSIKGKKLIRLWIAEGFIQNQQGKTLEEVAEDYLDELLNRSLVEVDEENFIIYKSTVRDISYKVHDIQREMIIVPKLENLGFCLHLTKESHFSSTKHFRRVSIGWDFANKSFFGDHNISSTRSLLSFSIMEIFSEQSLNQALGVARLLRVLDLGSAQIENVSEGLGNLQHLQYLSLRRTNIRVLPKSIGKLWNLQTLDVKYTHIVELPKELAYCCKLRHLLAYPMESDFEFDNRATDAVQIQGGVLEKFKELQTLVCLKADEASIVDGLGYLKQLRTLRIAKLRKEHGRKLCCAIEKMKYLRSLGIQSMRDDEILDIQYITTPPPLLECLYLDGLLEKLPEWIAKLNNLTSLQLISSQLKEDPLTSLQGLPNLMDLSLDNAFIGEKLDFGCTSFSKVVNLVLKNMHNLESIVGGRLLSAKVLYGCVDCQKLANYPDNIDELVQRGEERRNIIRDIRSSAVIRNAATLFKEAAEASRVK